MKKMALFIIMIFAALGCSKEGDILNLNKSFSLL